MKTIILATAAALAFTAPAFADKFDGSVSPAEFAAKHFAQDHEMGDGPRKVFRLTGEQTVISTKSSDLAERVRAHFAQDHEMGDGARYSRAQPTQSIISTKNGNLAAFAAEKLSNDGDRGDD